MQPGDNHVLVVARVTEQRVVRAGAVCHPRDVFVHPAASDLQLRPDGSVSVLDVLVGAQAWPPPNTESRSSAGVRVFGEICGF